MMPSTEQMMTCDELRQMPEYQEARRLAGVIADRDDEELDFVFGEAILVATATRMEHEGAAATPKMLWEEISYTQPAEVRDLLALRLDEPEEYARLPLAGVAEEIHHLSQSELSALEQRAERYIRGDA